MAISGGGTPDTSRPSGTPFRPVSAEFNHSPISLKVLCRGRLFCLVVQFKLKYYPRSATVSMWSGKYRRVLITVINYRRRVCACMKCDKIACCVGVHSTCPIQLNELTTHAHRHTSHPRVWCRQYLQSMTLVVCAVSSSKACS